MPADCPVANATIIPVAQSMRSNVATAGFIMFSLVILGLLFEFTVVKLERLWARRLHLVQLIHRVSKEIMILGFISLVLFIEDNSGAMTALATVMGEHFDRHMFEFIHFTFFVSICFNIAFMVCIMYISVRFAYQWLAIQQRGKGVVEQEYQKLLRDRAQAGLCGRIFNIRSHWRLLSLRDARRFFVLKSKFVKQHREEHWLDNSFNFAVYLVKSIRHMLLHLIEVHWMIWLSVMVCVILGTVLSKFFTPLAERPTLIILDVLSWVVWLSSIPLYFKVRAIWSHVVTKLDVELSPEDIKKNHKKLFWFGKPKLVFIAIQVIILYNAVFLSAYFMIELENGANWSRGVHVIIPALLSVFTFVPLMLPLYAMSVYTGGMSNHALIERIQQAALRRQASMIDISSLQEMLEMHPTDAAHHDMKHETGSTTELLGDHSQLHSQESIPMPIVRSLSAISLQALGQHDARKRNESMASIRRAESTASLHKHVHLAEPEPEFTVFPPEGEQGGGDTVHGPEAPSVPERRPALGTPVSILRQPSHHSLASLSEQHRTPTSLDQHHHSHVEREPVIVMEVMPDRRVRAATFVRNHSSVDLSRHAANEPVSAIPRVPSLLHTAPQPLRQRSVSILVRTPSVLSMPHHEKSAGHYAAGSQDIEAAMAGDDDDDDPGMIYDYESDGDTGRDAGHSWLE